VGVSCCQNIEERGLYTRTGSTSSINFELRVMPPFNVTSVVGQHIYMSVYFPGLILRHFRPLLTSNHYGSTWRSSNSILEIPNSVKWASTNTDFMVVFCIMQVPVSVCFDYPIPSTLLALTSVLGNRKVLKAVKSL
jgi:hypothetical protein